MYLELGSPSVMVHVLHGLLEILVVFSTKSFKFFNIQINVARSLGNRFCWVRVQTKAEYLKNLVFEKEFLNLNHFFFSISSWLLLQTLILSYFFFLYHKILSHLMVYVPIHLGVLKANRHVPPLYAALQVNLGFWLFPAVVILTLFLLFWDNLINHPKISTVTFLAISISLFLCIGISVAMIDGYKMIDGQGVPAFVEPYFRFSLEF
mgnify:CR=1 FL=1